VTKNSLLHSNGWYKPTVRMFKNLRTYLTGHRLLSEDNAPSYFLECLIYNVPDAAFGPTWQKTFVQAWNWLWQTAPVSEILCQNEQLLLFGTSTEQWQISGAYQLRVALRDLWNHW